MDIPDHVLNVGKALGLVQSLPLVESQKVEDRPILCDHYCSVELQLLFYAFYNEKIRF